MRKPFIAGNWKMYKTAAEAEAFAEEFKKIAEKIGKPVESVIALEVDFDQLVDRITGRRICPKCGAIYHITVKNPDGVQHGVKRVFVDGVEHKSNILAPAVAGTVVNVEVVMG